MTDEQKLKQLLSKQQFMVLAVTLEDGTPWAVPVRIRERNDNEFTWDSSLAALHSTVLNDRPETSITIFDKTGETMTGFYAKGQARLIEEPKPGYGRYKFVAETCWMNDETFVKREVNLP